MTIVRKGGPSKPNKLLQQLQSKLRLTQVDLAREKERARLLREALERAMTYMPGNIAQVYSEPVRKDMKLVFEIWEGTKPNG